MLVLSLLTSNITGMMKAGVTYHTGNHQESHDDVTMIMANRGKVYRMGREVCSQL